MENLEVIFKNIEVSEIDLLLEQLKFDTDNIRRSHFYKEGKDIGYSELDNLEKYFSTPGTGNLFVKYLDIGIKIPDVMLILSFDKKYGDITLNFPEENILFEETAKAEKEKIIKNKMRKILELIEMTSIIFGYEPAEDTDMLIFELEK